MVLPDPFPNSEVKHACADDSQAYVCAKVGSCPLNKELPLKGSFLRYRPVLVDKSWISVDRIFMIYTNII